jgi:hypothetical protein
MCKGGKMTLKYKLSQDENCSECGTSVELLHGSPVVLDDGTAIMAEDLQEGDRFSFAVDDDEYVVFEESEQQLFEHEMTIRFKTPSKLRDANSWKKAIEDRLLNGNPNRSRPEVKRTVTSVTLTRV